MKQKEIKISSNKSFGLVFFVIFIIIALWPLLNDGNIRIWSIIVSIIFLILGLLNSKILTPFNKLWMRLGALLGIIVSPIVMGVVYFGIITPIGLIMKLFGKDVLNLKLDKNKKTYWTLKKKIPSKMKDQF
jgi:predicted membrane metal-binding protein|tara:strand:+ start:176 stop:568 length:393 start_codon:yes stop_codon:yes gene_type:complete